jgi:osmotically-inducible protein OsmY
MVAQGRAMMRTDADLQRLVLAELRFDPRLQESYTHTAVLANDGIVTLSGQVHSYPQRVAAEEAALRLQGVRWTVNDLEVVPNPEEEKSDEELETALRTVLSWNSSLRGTSILVTVENGWVFLGGSVPWAYQKDIAEREAGQVVGVRGLTNSIAIEVRPVAVENIRHKIAEALRRNALVDRLRVDALTSGDEVILRGKVKTWAERNEAARIAWSSPGVRSVDNQLTVDDDGPI